MLLLANEESNYPRYYLSRLYHNLYRVEARDSHPKVYNRADSSREFASWLSSVGHRTEQTLQDYGFEIKLSQVQLCDLDSTELDFRNTYFSRCIVEPTLLCRLRELAAKGGQGPYHVTS